MTVHCVVVFMASLICVTRYGFVPNGGRVYYTHRSQPPLLIQMVDVYTTSTGDMEFLRSVLPALFMEYEFWIENRTVTYVVDDYVRYGAELDVPRPESYREDLDTARNSSKLVDCPRSQAPPSFQCTSECICEQYSSRKFP